MRWPLVASGGGLFRSVTSVGNTAASRYFLPFQRALSPWVHPATARKRQEDNHAGTNLFGPQRDGGNLSRLQCQETPSPMHSFFCAARLGIVRPWRRSFFLRIPLIRVAVLCAGGSDQPLWMPSCGLRSGVRTLKLTGTDLISQPETTGATPGAGLVGPRTTSWASSVFVAGQGSGTRPAMVAGHCARLLRRDQPTDQSVIWDL